MISNKTMSRHVSLVHGSYSDRQHKCTVCEKRFKSKRDLIDHTNIHTGERPHMCNICGAKFVNNSNRRMHVRLVHFGEKRQNVKEA